MKQTNKAVGFTLVEMIIVIAIILVLSAGVFGTSYLFKDQAAFKLNYERVLSLLHDARNMALSSQSYPDTNDYDKDGLFYEPDGDIILPNGYIVHFDLTGDKPVVGLYADLFDSVINELDPANDRLIKQYELDENIVITPEGFTQANNPAVLPNAGENFSVIYTTPDASFFVLEMSGKTTLQCKISQTGRDGNEARSKYIFMQYLFGTPELMDTPYISS
ncbi:prepilin-type N-terminal cleavage/methylation domain-containing protein [Candidatus Peregrinibacteria bacterium]|nr:prepilin-type N-terminal cleavage/methylation domain-containing protein [Candidatus Peregrinibacteria bacterium]